MIVNLDKAIQKLSADGVEKAKEKAQELFREEGYDPMSMTQVIKQPTEKLKDKSEHKTWGDLEFVKTHPVHEHRLNDLVLQLKNIQNDPVHMQNIESQLTESDRKKVQDLRDRFNILFLKNLLKEPPMSDTNKALLGITGAVVVLISIFSSLQ